MNLATILLIPLISGYAFAVTWDGSKYHAAREEGYRLYFRTALYGLVLLIAASLLHLYVASSYEHYLDKLQNFLTVFTPHNPGIARSEVIMLNIGAYTIILGLLLGHALNTLPSSKRVLLHYATRNDDFERLVLRALRKLMPICVTMSNGKVYVGYVISTIDPSSERTALRILPLLSGYRDKDDCSMNFNTSYHEVYEKILDAGTDENEQHILSHLEIRDFEKVLPFNEIRSSHLFDIAAYKTFTLHKPDALQQLQATPELAEQVNHNHGLKP